MDLPATSVGPQVEFQDEKRQMLLGKLKDTLDCTVSPTAWACLWLSDISTLEEKVAPVNPSQLEINRSFLENFDLGVIGRQWSQRHRSKSTTSSPRSTPSVRSKASLPSTPLQQLARSDQPEAQESELQPATSVTMITTPTRGVKCKVGDVETKPTMSKRMRGDNEPRSIIAKEECRRRDGALCILTKYPDPIDVAHIFPFSMGSDKQDKSFWNLLKIFWSQERVDAWYNAVFQRGTEVLENLMCFAPHVHRWHTKGLFALQPVKMSEDGKCLTLKFYWLPRRSTSVEMDIMDTPSIPEDLTGLPRNLKAWNVITERKICSGDEIHLETPDPDNLPLPDVRILDMQWVLQRLMALSGAAEPCDNYLNDDDDEEGDPVSVEGSQIDEDDYG
ncbi:hypothetical protein D8B26_005746 [Coccidioides posadasii str. Silveira]|uniref:Uncharacterized protein n=1 Tax=Coccidioides posadasii (strain RMSCC 757 / Silveira) TaxID=443226 RepID=E9DAS8_COCPS|nr:hypothetical protein CPSG_06930 [Coccidioides posadasii str. Silveira]QVM11096.1 hypothetical protein D8B26_005746 [Coccidioides posadasii str. Silveira]